jgi:hypothetical protein
MKIKLLLFAVAVFMLGACTQKTCPTYSKLDVKKEKPSQRL